MKISRIFVVSFYIISFGLLFTHLSMANDIVLTITEPKTEDGIPDNNEQKQTPKLYGNQDPLPPLTITDTPYVESTPPLEPAPASSQPLIQQTPSSSSSPLTVTNEPYVENPAKETSPEQPQEEIETSTPTNPPSVEIFPGNAEIPSKSASQPMLEPPPKPMTMTSGTVQTSNNTDRDDGWFDWLFDLFDDGSSVHSSPSASVCSACLVRKPALNARDVMYLEASRHYPGQPLAKYAEYVAATGVSVIPRTNIWTNGATQAN